MTNSTGTKRYRVNWATRLINAPFTWLARQGLGADYRYMLTVRGRRSGKPYSTPVDAIEHGGRRWLVAPYGVTNWVRNARAAGEVELRRGDRTQRMLVKESSGAVAVPILRRYLELVPVTRPYFALGPEASDDALAAEVARHPVFQLDPATESGAQDSDTRHGQKESSNEGPGGSRPPAMGARARSPRPSAQHWQKRAWKSG